MLRWTRPKLLKLFKSEKLEKSITPSDWTRVMYADVKASQYAYRIIIILLVSVLYHLVGKNYCDEVFAYNIQDTLSSKV